MAKGITETDVHGAADALVVTGERPTVERIRAHLGTGSPNTVTRWLESWWQGLGARLSAQQARLNLPAAPAHVAALAAQWWEQAISAARTDAAVALSGEREALEHDRRELAAQEAAWREQIDQHTQVAEQVRQLLNLAEQRQLDLQQLCDQQASQIADLTTQRTTAQGRAERLETELTALQARWDDRETSIDAEREAQRQHLRGVEDRAHAEIDRARQETKLVRAELTARVRRQEAELQAARKREQGAHQTLVKAQQEIAAQHARADTLASQLQLQASKSPQRAPSKKTARQVVARRPSKGAQRH